jgi:CheY-like chemotaxis protein
MPMHNLQALVVDDSKVGRLTMMKKLEAMGLKVELAESGQQAFEYLARQHPDLIFMDHMMPEMDGFEVTRRIKADPATHEIPVIIISGNDEAEFIAEARAAGAIDAIAKPPATEVLETLLASLEKLGTAAPKPATVVPAPAPAVDMAEVQALVERLLGAAMTPLRAEVMAELADRFDAVSDNQRKTQAEWSARLDQQADSVAGIRHSVAAVEALGNRVQGMEQRLLPLEAEAGRVQPDFNGLQADIDQRIAAGLAGLQARAEGWIPQLDSMRQGLQVMQAGVDAQAVQVEQKASAWSGLLETFAEELARISKDMQSLRTAQVEWERRMEQRIAQIQEAAGEAATSVRRHEATPVRDDGEKVTDEALKAIQTELGELRERLSDARMQTLVADILDNPKPDDTEAPCVVESHDLPPQAFNHALQAEVDRLKAKVKRLGVMTAIGGALLLTAIGMALFGG